MRMLGLIAFLIIFSAPVARADFAAGAQAYDGGDYAEAFNEWVALARRGDAAAQVAVADLYRSGAGRSVDDARAASWYARAAAAGHPIAQVNLGEMYLTGSGVRRDAVTAYVWFDRAVRRGNTWAVGARIAWRRR
jgi:TPR repeat protein